jgi:hypothetical protein
MSCCCEGWRGNGPGWPWTSEGSGSIGSAAYETANGLEYSMARQDEWLIA